MDWVNEIEKDEEELLIGEIELEMRKMCISIVELLNNQSVEECSDPLEKFLITNLCYSSCLLQRGIDDKINSNEDKLIMYKTNLQEELDCLITDLNHLVKKINEYKDTISSLETNITNLKSMTQASSKGTSLIKNMDDIMRNIKMRFKREKSDLKSIITTLFADNLDIQDLIARIIEHHFKEGSDKYLELNEEDNITHQIELLRRTNLFDINSNDILQIKLADLM